MGLLIIGSPLTWGETKKYIRHVRQAGIQQFLHMYDTHKHSKDIALLWGDEIEYSAIYLDHSRNEARVALVASDLLPSLEGKGGFLWAPEFADHMIEGIPGEPFSDSITELLGIETFLKNRRECLSEALTAVNPSIIPLTITTFPRLGCSRFTEPTFIPSGDYGKSFFFPNDVINHHTRYRSFEQNIRERRGERPAINIPMYIDTDTDTNYFTNQQLIHNEPENPAKPGHIYMDHMGFGMGNSCLQMTYQAANLDQARYMYDQLSLIGPIIVALSNSSPLYHGFISDLDCRFEVIEQSVDDRTRQERHSSPTSFPNSRYSVIDCFIATDMYNDMSVLVDQESYDTLTCAGVDNILSRHIAHLFARDPLILYSNTLEIDNTASSVHFDNLNSSNWNNVRLKPPPHGSTGWRVEFRPIDVQLTDFENAAFMIFVNLLLRVFLDKNINLYIPVSQMQENFKRSFKKDSCKSQEYYFRSDIFTPLHSNTYDSVVWDINTIINGKEGIFGGFLDLIREYINQSDELNSEQKLKLVPYLNLIRDRARGQLMTGANWIREFVLSHPNYKHDSAVCEQICFDLMVSISKLSNHTSHNSSTQLTGNNFSSFFLIEDEL
ncbi:Glutamate-cysteine ligase, catalytic subunit [Oopsacas minuta]|uniref:Glutamate--cysteine ligase n=1 Tax=Oopsacas minuta TaxID=111878 RepID=A0AAV7JBS3_9METZ|nr:Glutamate-cysteine ligase, catalytic subunit [Oopsacas minuta]